MMTPVKIHRNKKKTSDLVGKRGKIVSWTMIRVAAKLFSEQAPYPVVIVQLESKSKVIGQLVDWKDEDLQTDKEVVAVLRRSGIEDKEGVIAYSIKFKPL